MTYSGLQIVLSKTIGIGDTKHQIQCSLVGKRIQRNLAPKSEDILSACEVVNLIFICMTHGIYTLIEDFECIHANSECKTLTDIVASSRNAGRMTKDKWPILKRRDKDM